MKLEILHLSVSKVPCAQESWTPESSAIRAFTLIELLVVVSVLLILGGITVGVLQPIQEQSARSRAQGELVVLAQALEDYKAYYGDYPWIHSGTDGSIELYAALIGHRLPNGGTMPGKGKHFVELSKFRVGEEGEAGEFSVLEKEDLIPNLPESLDKDYKEHRFLDPWRNPYIYKYKVDSRKEEWQRVGYILVSKGPDEEEVKIGKDGFLEESYRDSEAARDDIFVSDAG